METNVSYRYISITAQIAPFVAGLSESFHKSVLAESRLANAAPDLLNAIRYVDWLLVTLTNANLTDADRRIYIQSAQDALRVAMEIATGSKERS